MRADDATAGDLQRVRDEARMDYDPEPTLQDEEREDERRELESRGLVGEARQATQGTTAMMVEQA